LFSSHLLYPEQTALPLFVNVIILTVFIGLLLVTFFIGFFLYVNSHRGSIERDALMPLQDEKPRPAGRSSGLKKSND
jgi:uncharacterized membrane protein YczE